MSEERAEGRNGGGPVAENRKARHDYFIDETIEAGIVLVGSEIKSVRARHVNLRESYVRIERGEAWLLNAHISTWPQAGTHWNHEPTRPRKLLLHQNEIDHLRAKVEQKGQTLVPLRMYLVRGRAKLEVAIARGKKLYDKRDSMAERDSQREIERAFSERNRGGE
ncbi:MAG: SsrA-binding protein SmpB [Chloroflexi bacterium]|nr:SsrA-binding protein SmpB [Chloroflexota bacterium]